MATTTDFRNGLVMKMDGELWGISEFQHVKPGKGGAFVRTKLKNLKTGRVIDRTFKSGEKVEDVRIERKQVQYLYEGDGELYFMDVSTYDQFPIPRDVVGDAINFLKEAMVVDAAFNGDTALGIELPIFVELVVQATDPGVKGDTATGGTKPATLETGAVLQVPLFLEEGTLIKVDTRTGQYVERVK